MSRSNDKPKPRIDAVLPPALPPVAPIPVTKTIAVYRRCPICWEGSGGYGDCYSTQGATRYYKCKQSTKLDCGPCGHTWTATVIMEAVKIEHRIVTLDGER